MPMRAKTSALTVLELGESAAIAFAGRVLSDLGCKVFTHRSGAEPVTFLTFGKSALLAGRISASSSSPRGDWSTLAARRGTQVT